MKKLFISIILLIFLQTSQAQSKGGWPFIPGFDPALPTTLTDRTTLVGVIGFAALSYGLEEFVFKKHENLNFYTARIGMNNEYAFGLKNVWHQNIGVEHRIANWFSVSAELNIQEWHDTSPNIENKQKTGMGLGVMTYYTWYILGKMKLCPFIEYGAGAFLGFKKFPYNGTQYTFNHSTQLGLEYTINDSSKARISYGHFNQSNYNLLDSNPAYNGNGFSLAYAWRM